MRAAAPRDVVWEVLADSRGYAQWGIWDTSEIEREGAPPPGGVGAIRRLTMDKRVIREQITTFDSPSRVEYRLLSGLPLDDYSATVNLTPFHGGTEIRWRSNFDVKLGFLIGRFAEKRMNGVLEEVATAMAREAERRAAGPPA